MKRIFNGSGGRKTALILSLCLIFALAVGHDVRPAQGEHRPRGEHLHCGQIRNGHRRGIGWKPEKGASSSKTPGTAVSYVRVKLVMNWVDESGNVSADPVNITPSITDDWFEQGGIYYYKMPVAAKGETTNLLQTPITQGTAPEGYHLEVTVLAESIQAAPSKAVTDSWGVGVDSNGYLTQPTTTP